MPYIIVTNAQRKDMENAAQDHEQYVIGEEPDKVDLALDEADFVVLDGNLVPREKMKAFRIGIKNWYGGSEEEVKKYSKKVANQLTSTGSLVYPEVFEISAEVE